MIPFRTDFDGVKYTRHNIFPLTEREANRQSKALWKEGFAVEVTHTGSEYYIYLQNDKGWLR